MSRPQLTPLTGVGKTLAEFLNANWPSGKTNQELAGEWDYNAPGIISMWRTGKSKVPIEMIPTLADYLGVDIAFLLPLWMEQYTAGKKQIVNEVVRQAFRQMVTTNEFALVRRARGLGRAQKKRDPEFTAKQLEAVEHVLANDLFAGQVIAVWKAGGPSATPPPVPAT